MHPKGPSARIFLVRHGETDDNHGGVFQGQAGRGLNARGRVQAEKLALRLAELEPGIDLHALYTSDLERAVDTAHILSEVLGLPVHVDEGLREVFVGEWQGKTAREVEEIWPDEVAAWKAGLDVRRGGGETYAELAARIAESIDRVILKHQGGHLLFVSHGAAIKAFVTSLFGPVAPGLKVLGPISNTGVTVLDRERDGTTRLVVWNDVSHLRDPVVTAAKTLHEPPPPARSSKRVVK